MKVTRVKLITDFKGYKEGELGWADFEKTQRTEMWDVRSGCSVPVDFDNGAKLEVIWEDLEIIREEGVIMEDIREGIKQVIEELDIQCPICGCEMEVISSTKYGLGLRCPKCGRQISLEE